MDIETILHQMTTAQKISFCTGGDFWNTKAIPALSVPAIKMSDGPHGVRCQSDDTDMLGLNVSHPSTCFPTAVTAGATWDKDLLWKEGEAIGKEALALGVSLVLGPGCNIKRDPKGGRCFEYFSEDPYVAGKMAAAFIQGVQSTGAGASLKHFAANNQEYKRQNGDSRLDERTLREIYLAPFEIAVKEGRPETVMCAYNKINGVYAAENKMLLNDILRTEWGFDGAVVTDWGALSDRIGAFLAGCDLNMPGGERYMERATLRAVKNGTLGERLIDASVQRILKLALKERPLFQGVDHDAHHALARKIAEGGAVLLKNDGDVLPAKKEEICLIGYMAKEMRYQGCGSSRILPTRLPSLTDILPDVPFLAASDAEGNASDEEVTAAVALAKTTHTPIVLVGLPASYESEAFDRAHLRLPDGYGRLVEAVAKANPRTVVLLFGGGVMELPWADSVSAILYMGLPGQAGAEAAVRLLLGDAVPSGKLTESWPFTYEDCPTKDTFGEKDPEYLEGIYVGYRYYETAGVPVRFPFGYGLSYTHFTYSDLTVEGRSVSLTVTNTGAYAGDEIVQLYVAPPKGGIHRPRKTLAGFEKMHLMCGESKRVTFALDDRAFSVYADGWHSLSGIYGIEVGASLSDIRLSGEMMVEGETIPAPAWQKNSFYERCRGLPKREEWELLMGAPVPKAPSPKRGAFTMDNTMLEMREHSFAIRLLARIAVRLVGKSHRGKRDGSDPQYHMMLVSVLDCPMRATVICGEGRMKERFAHALVHLANGRPLRAIGAMLKRY